MATRRSVWVDRGIVIAVGVIPLAITLGSGLWTIGSWFAGLQASVSKQITEQIAPVATKVGELSGKVADVSTKVDASTKDLSNKVDSATKDSQNATNVIQLKQDALNSKVDSNVTEQQAFRTSVQAGFSKLFDATGALKDQINQERVDRLTDSAKKK